MNVLGNKIIKKVHKIGRLRKKGTQKSIKLQNIIFLYLNIPSSNH